VAVEEHAYEPVTSFEQWYVDYQPDENQGLRYRSLTPCADMCRRQYMLFKNEMDQRVSNYQVLEKLADAEVISPKPDLPNVSSGETAGLVRRIARNLVQNAPNVEVVCKFNDDDIKGIFSRHILTSKVISSDHYSNDMQQNLFASTKTGLTLGFDCVIPVLLRDPRLGWFIKYDSIHYRDVFPEPGAKDIRDANVVYVRRYLTKADVYALIRNNAPGWDINALKALCQTNPAVREQQSQAYQTQKHKGSVPQGYEIITRYTNDGQPFLTFAGQGAGGGMLLRIELNKHPQHEHPVFFLVLEKDDMQPLGKSQVELLVGRQDFQDLMLNGAMKLWYRNINPSIIGYGTVNAIPNLSPGKYTQISNPNAKVEAFEVNTQTLMQYGQISQQNLGSMVNLVGSADQQMATQAGNGMSATPQGVEAQQAMVDITTNNYQKAIESFFSHYCSYALTIFFQELKAVKKVELTADARIKLLEAGMDPEVLNDDGTLDIDFEELAIEYWVRVVPGSLTELEDEKQLRILNELFVPLSQSMPALAAAGDTQALQKATAAMMYIIGKQIELSGATSAKEIGMLWNTGDVQQVTERDARIAAVEDSVDNIHSEHELQLDLQTEAIKQLQEQVRLITENQGQLLNKLGVPNPVTTPGSATNGQEAPPQRELAGQTG
jgi:hypothetical protein